MITLRRAKERGQFDHGWLDTRHSFSFAEYQDPAHMGFRALRVINEDRVAPGAGFPPHPHRDMEIISYVIEGALQHRDSMGNGSVIRPGDIQVMSAGTGITHSEFNPSGVDPVHFLQIWIRPDTRGLPPSYQQQPVPGIDAGPTGLLASCDGREGPAVVHQDVGIYIVNLAPDADVTIPLAFDRYAWLQMVKGSVELGGERLHAGDGAAIEKTQSIHLSGQTRAEVLLFDLN